MIGVLPPPVGTTTQGFVVFVSICSTTALIASLW